MAQAAILASVLLAVSAWAGDATALPIAVAPNDPNLRYVGRFDLRKPEAPACAWPGSTIVAKFKGTAINVKMRGSKGEDFFEVITDGARQPVLVLNKDQTVYRVAEKLAGGEHLLELVKRTETMSSTTAFLGLELEAGGGLVGLPPRPERRIEVYGDSVSCGNSNEGTKANEPMARKLSNNYCAYGAIASRALNAEYTCIAWSGRKLWPDSTLPSIYDLTLAPWDNAPKWNFAWIPHVVVINLGSNDYGKGAPEEQGWTTAYKEFIKTLRSHYPDCHVFCCLCSSIMGKDRAPMRRLTQKVVESLQQAGDKKIHYVEFKEQAAPDGIGPGWHPNIKTHQIMAETLAAEIKRELNW